MWVPKVVRRAAGGCERSVNADLRNGRRATAPERPRGTKPSPVSSWIQSTTICLNTRRRTRQDAELRTGLREGEAPAEPPGQARQEPRPPEFRHDQGKVRRFKGHERRPRLRTPLCLRRKPPPSIREPISPPRGDPHTPIRIRPRTASTRGRRPARSEWRPRPPAEGGEIA